MDLHGLALTDEDLGRVVLAFPHIHHLDLSFCKVARVVINLQTGLILFCFLCVFFCLISHSYLIICLVWSLAWPTETFFMIRLHGDAETNTIYSFAKRHALFWSCRFCNGHSKARTWVYALAF